MCICMKTIFLWHQCAGLFYMSLFSLFFFFSLSAYVLKLYYTNKLPINLTKISQKKYIFISSTCLFSMNNYVGFSLSSCILLHIFRWHHLSICIHQYSDFKAKKKPEKNPILISQIHWGQTPSNVSLRIGLTDVKVQDE